MDASLRALNRFGMGARRGEARRVAADPRGWLEAQLEGDPPSLDADLPSLDDLGRLIQDQRRAPASGDLQGSGVRQRVGRATSQETVAALTARMASDRPFVERLVAFWSNHLCVSAAAKLPVRVLAGAYERQAIRPHVLGRFDDLVLASARHPAMLVYLDNVQSVGPRSQRARLAERAAGRTGRRPGAQQQPQRPARQPGINENYARELMELHTVGVNGGYTQEDVQELARILTGWTVSGLGPQAVRRLPGMPDGVGFAFVEPLHEPGAKRVMETRYPEAGEEEGVRVIRDLCRSPEAAAFLAEKLVRHFVADEPPASAVERVAGVFRDTEGDLREVARALVRLDEAWDPANPKFRTPQDWLVASVRALGGRQASPEMGPILQQLRHPLWAPGAPKGFGDTTREWADPDSLMNRAELARTLAQRVMAGGGRGGAFRPGARRLDPSSLADVMDLPAGDPLPGILADESVSVDERVALALAGPAFQWR